MTKAQREAPLDKIALQRDIIAREGAMSIKEIVLPETKPATEWVRGRALQKVSPQDPHARAQLNLGSAMLAWAKEGGRGRVGTEWEFRVTPPHEITRPLIPDIAFLSFARLAFEERDAARIPRMAPTVAVEIVSPDDRRADIDDKIRTYLAAGTQLVLLAEPKDCSFTAYDSEGVLRFAAGDTFTHSSMPGFSIKVASVFEEIRPK
ncbi:MAG: Uma2 family endonuclease [Candidatus Eremiobacteraeota bacterium]|nr:Uma2 family endonuclease [Candidatus Eremiobacteraeota bacterium]